MTRKRRREDMTGEPLVSLPYSSKKLKVSPLEQIQWLSQFVDPSGK